MRILLYNPDNGVTRNFMPHLWMFLLQSLTPAGHEVLLIDGNAQSIDEAGIARYVREQKIGLVGIGAMTRMIAKAYRMADAVRAAGVPVVMGGPHVTEMADEALGRNGGARHADAVALGEVFLDELVLAGEVAIQRHLSGAGPLGDRGGRRGVKPAERDELRGGLDDPLACVSLYCHRLMIPSGLA